jgi:hypothetical protein
MRWQCKDFEQARSETDRDHFAISHASAGKADQLNVAIVSAVSNFNRDG